MLLNLSIQLKIQNKIRVQVELKALTRFHVEFHLSPSILSKKSASLLFKFAFTFAHFQHHHCNINVRQLEIISIRSQLIKIERPRVDMSSLLYINNSKALNQFSHTEFLCKLVWFLYVHYLVIYFKSIKKCFCFTKERFQLDRRTSST